MSRFFGFRSSTSSRTLARLPVFACVNVGKPIRAGTARWKAISDPVWKKEYAGLYRKPVADAHALSASHARQHSPTPDADQPLPPRSADASTDKPVIATSPSEA